MSFRTTHLARRQVVRTTALLIAVVAILVGLTQGASATSPVASAASPAASATPIAWKGCGGGFQCATVRVPLDYRHPAQATLSLSLIRLPALSPSRRLGSLFVDPGGPGDSGVDFVRSEARTLYSAGVRSRFDVIGFDPRGTGRSTPLQCFASQTQEDDVFADVPVFPVTPQEVTTTERANAQLSEACARRQPQLAAHMTTADVARDLDMLRARVGDRQLTYVGYSYGTYIGTVYANMFPDKVRAIVADGVVDPNEWYGTGPAGTTVPVDARLRSDTGTSAALDAFLTACDTHRSRCSFAARNGTSKSKFATLMHRLREHPATVPGTGSVSYADAVGYVRYLLYHFDNWTSLGHYLQSLWKASASVQSTAATPAPVATTIDSVLRSSRGARTAADYDSSLDAAEAVTCSDSRNPSNPATFVRSAAERDERAPYFGSYWTWLDEACATWTLPSPTRYTGPFDRKLAHPMLVIGVLRDPATRYADAVSLARLSPGARLLSIDGTGHTSMHVGTSCATSVTSRYLLTLQLPNKGASCRVTDAPFK